MKYKFNDIASAELSSRLTSYRQILTHKTGQALEETRAELNHRYFCLQTALWMDTHGKQPAIIKPEEDVRAELRRWMREIQRETTHESQYQDAEKIALIQSFLDATAPITPEPVQLKIQ